MFEIGDKVLYPMQGAGIVEDIENNQVDGKLQVNYVIFIPCCKMRVKIPKQSAIKMGVRQVVDHTTFVNVLDKVRDLEWNTATAPREKYKIQKEKLKSGELRGTVEVVKELQHKKNEKSLNATEKQMLNEAQKLLMSELRMVNGISDTEISSLLDI